MKLLEGWPTGVKNEIGSKTRPVGNVAHYTRCVPKVLKSVELYIVSKRLLLEHRAFILKSRMAQWECAMNIFYIIGVVVVIIFVASFLGVHV